MTRGGRVTLRHIADETGLSVATVSYALRGLQVPEVTQTRVRDAAERLGYRADPIARALASGRTGYVGLLCRSLVDPWQQALAAQLGRDLWTLGRPALIVDASNDPETEEQLAEQLAGQRVDALIALPVDPTADHWTRIAESTVLVSLGDTMPHAATAAEVVFDNSAAVLAALGRLREAGHQRIAVLTPGEASTPDRPVEVVAQEYAASTGLEVSLHTSPCDIEGSALVAHALLEATSSPTGFFCLSDSMAYGVYSAARGLGLDIPTHLSVIGLDDSPFSSLLTPALAGYHWPMGQVIREVIERTVRAIDDGERSGRVVIEASARPGCSVGRPHP